LLITDTGRLDLDVTETESLEVSTIRWRHKQDEDTVLGRVKYLLLYRETPDIESEKANRYM
jgi:hypothetical protein